MSGERDSSGGCRNCIGLHPFLRCALQVLDTPWFLPSSSAPLCLSPSPSPRAPMAFTSVPQKLCSEPSGHGDGESCLHWEETKISLMSQKLRRVLVYPQCLAVKMNDSTKEPKILFWCQKTRTTFSFSWSSCCNNFNTPALSPMALGTPNPTGHYSYLWLPARQFFQGNAK